MKNSAAVGAGNNHGFVPGEGRIRAVLSPGLPPASSRAAYQSAAGADYTPPRTRSSVRGRSPEQTAGEFGRLPRLRNGEAKAKDGMKRLAATPRGGRSPPVGHAVGCRQRWKPALEQPGH